MEWDKEVLLDRANRWAEKHCYMALTEASFIEWKKEGLIPPPNPKGRGQGLGKAQKWSTIAYRRTLQILRMRANGIIHRREQRLYLWLTGNDIPIKFIRKDLILFLKRNIKKLNRDSQTDFWEPSNPIEIPKKTKNRITKILFDLKADEFLQEVINQIDLNIPNLMENLIYAFFSSEADIFNKYFGFLKKAFPYDDISIAEILLGIKSFIGFAANPDDLDLNPILEAINNFSDQTLIDIRNFSLILLNSPKYTFSLFLNILENNPQDFIRHQFIMQIKPIISFYKDSPPIISVADKILLFSFLVNRKFILGGDTEVYKKLVLFRIDKFLYFLANNQEVIFSNKLSNQGFIDLILASDLPVELKALLKEGSTIE